MGWTGLPICNANKMRMSEIKQLLIDEFTYKFREKDDTTVKTTVSYISLKFGEAYLACRTIREKEEIIIYDHTFAAVVLWRALKNEFMYKAMDESEHPYYYNAPKKLIKMLSSTTSENELEWRKQVLSRFKTR